MINKIPTSIPIFSYYKIPHVIIFSSTYFFFQSIYLYQSNSSYILEWELININSSSVSIPILLEPESILFIFTVSFISFNVLTFSKVYIISDHSLQRFTQIVMAFIFSIIILIVSPNIITIILGWDGLGITRFLLVIYYNNSQSLKSGFITLASNRIGDCLILVTIGIIISQGHWQIFSRWKEEVFIPSYIVTLIILAAITKRAQFPFIAWLTCAIAAPTPVSALVHSSTLVTAGVFLLIRFYPTLSNFTHFNIILIRRGSITILLGAFWAMTNKDIKQVVALSTISQLGLIITTLSVGILDLSFFHILTHAIFKATIFISVGINIIFKLHSQNFANLGGIKYSRTISLAVVVRVLSINAIFFTAGYYSKDIILEIIWFRPNMWSTVITFIPATILTITYSTRLWRITFSTKIKFRTFYFSNIKENLKKTSMMNNKILIIEIPFIIITVASITSGAFIFWILLSPGDSAIVPSHIQWAAPLCVLIGWLIASINCPSNKAKLIDRTIFKLSLKYIDKGYYIYLKTLPGKNLNYNISLNSIIKIKVFSLMSKNFENYKFHVKSKQAKNSNHDAAQAQLFDMSESFVNYNYILATNLLKISLKIEQSLDLGLFKFITTKSITNVLTSKGKVINRAEKNTINIIIIQIICIIIIINLVYIKYNFI